MPSGVRQTSLSGEPADLAAAFCHASGSIGRPTRVASDDCSTRPLLPTNENARISSSWLCCRAKFMNSSYSPRWSDPSVAIFTSLSRSRAPWRFMSCAAASMSPSTASKLREYHQCWIPKIDRLDTTMTASIAPAIFVNKLMFAHFMTRNPFVRPLDT